MYPTLVRTCITTFTSLPTANSRRASSIVRCYATHRGSLDSSPLSQSLDQNRGTTPRSRDSVGPFQLGLSQPSAVYEEVKPWSELSKTGKGQRTQTIFMIIFLTFSEHSRTSDSEDHKSHRDITGCWAISLACLFAHIGTVLLKLAYSATQSSL